MLLVDNLNIELDLLCTNFYIKVSCQIAVAFSNLIVQKVFSTTGALAIVPAVIQIADLYYCARSSA